jgi:hypothetical protein
MFSEENLPGRLVAGTTDEPARSFKPSEEDHPVRAGHLLLQSLENHLPYFRRNIESSFKQLCLSSFFIRASSRRNSVFEEIALTSASPGP